MSLYVMAFMGTAPFGSFMAGSLAGIIGAPYTVLSSGIICLIGAILFIGICHHCENIFAQFMFKKEYCRKYQQDCDSLHT